jgi:hypothetical protein
MLATLDLTSEDPVLCPQIFVLQQEFLIDHSGDVGQHPRPKHLGFPLNLQPRESEIVDAVFQSEKSIRGEPVESCNLRYFNSFEFFDHTRFHQASRFRPAEFTCPNCRAVHFTLESAEGVFWSATQSSMRSLSTSIGKAPPSSTSSWNARISNLSPS